MSFEAFMTNDLEQILKAGASIEIKVGARMVDDWARLAKAAKNGGGTLTILGVKTWTTNLYVQVASAGPGHVAFKD